MTDYVDFIETVPMRKMLFLVIVLSISALAYSATHSLSAAGKVTGFFRLEKRSFCVGEPILLEFLVTNGSSSPHSFFVGGDYRGTLRHSRFFFSVQNEQGRDFTQKLSENLGGVGGRITLKPSESYAEWQLLNAWTHLLPPGHYCAHCKTKLKDDMPLLPPPPTESAQKAAEQSSKPVEIAQEIQFDITNYDKAKILTTVRRLKKEDSEWGGVKPGGVVQPKPLGWAFDDLAEKFQTGIERGTDENKFETDVLFAIPWIWNDRYLLEYALGYGQRNWISTDPYKDAWLKISVLNNSNQQHPLRFRGSSLFVNGVEVNNWEQRLKSAMEASRITNVIEPGALAEISIKCTDLLINAALWKFVWNVDGFSKHTQISYIEPRRGSDIRCQYGFMGAGNGAEIYRLQKEQFTKIWPPSNWTFLDGNIESEIRFGKSMQGWDSSGWTISMPWKPIPWEKTYLVLNRFCDVDDDGRLEIVTLTDVVSRKNPGRRLSIHKLRIDYFDRFADLSPASLYPAVEIMGIRRLKDRKQIVVRLADVKRCGDDVTKLQEGVMTAAGYDFRNRELKQSWVNDKIDITLVGTVKDLDGDGDVEMIFTPGEHQSLPQGPTQKMLVILKGVKDFLPYTASK